MNFSWLEGSRICQGQTTLQDKDHDSDQRITNKQNNKHIPGFVNDDETLWQA